MSSALRLLKQTVNFVQNRPKVYIPRKPSSDRIIESVKGNPEPDTANLWTNHSDRFWNYKKKSWRLDFQLVTAWISICLTFRRLIIPQMDCFYWVSK